MLRDLVDQHICRGEGVRKRICRNLERTWEGEGLLKLPRALYIYIYTHMLLI